MKKAGRQGPKASERAFSLIEMLVGVAVLGLIIVVLMSILNTTSSLTQQATEKIAAFQGARRAFSIISNVLGQATLNSYWDYDDPMNPERYLRKSELHFLSGPAGTGALPGTLGTGHAMVFQVPLGRSNDENTYGGLDHLLNACGFFIEYAEVPSLPSPPFPPVSPPNYRYQLMQALEASEDLRVYSATTGTTWIQNLANTKMPIADNVILLVAWPRRSPQDDPEGDDLTSGYSYDSRANANDKPQPVNAHQLPPTIQILMVAIDQKSAARLCTGASPPAAIQELSDNLFLTSNELQNQEDVKELRKRLDDPTLNINYRIFTSTIPIRESKMQ